MKSLIVAALIAGTAIATVPTTASALGVFVGPRGGVGVRVGGFGYRRPFVGPRYYGRSVGYGWHRGFRRHW